METHGSLVGRNRGGSQTRRRIAVRVLGQLRVYLTVSNAIGAAIIFVYFAWIFPAGDRQERFGVTSLNAVVGFVYFVIAAAFATWRAERAHEVLRRWRHDDSPATAEDRADIMCIPTIMVILSAINWGVAIPIFFLVNLADSFEVAFDIAASIFMAGFTVCGAVYLVAERITRPVLGYVLDPRAPTDAGALGVSPRIVLTWALLSGVPLIGIISVPLGRLPDDPRGLIAPIVFLAGVALVVGLVGMRTVAQTISRPVRDLRRAMDRVAEGDIGLEVRVNDASEIGRLQAGFNHMLEGLRERERIRELFGRQVGDDVAREALERGVTLGGRQQTIAALFVDVIGSTGLAGREPPERVVELLNGFFAIVVETVARHGGLVNKFEGDGALCVFGAPEESEHFATAALAAARELRDRLERESPLDAAIGVSCGTAVAGHVGAEERYEYTVIGDPVNEAARLCELAKERPGRTLASATTVEQATEGEPGRWRLDGEVRLRGRIATTRLALPVAVASARVSAA